MNIKITNASITLGANTILEEINLEIKQRDKIAIVGRNGAGKTTLLRALIDNEMFDYGIGEEKFSVKKLGNPKIGYLRQMDFDDEELTLLEELQKPFKELIEMESRLEEYVSKMNENNSPEVIQKYSDLQERYKLLGGYSYKKEYEIMLNKFGFDSFDKEKNLKNFSGGQKTKIAFIKLLLSKPDLLLLDEPTNHLDIKTIMWLEDYLCDYPSAIVIVSHDRMFINKIANIIYDIDYGRTIRYVGDYTAYEKMKSLNYLKQLKDYEYQQKEIKRLQAIYERFRFKPSKASMALSKLRQIEKMDILEKPNKIDTRTFKTNLDSIIPSVKNVLKMTDLEIGYDDVLAKINLNIMRGKKIGVIGENGIGKSTLLKTIQGLLEPLGGSLEYGLHVNPGYFDQTLSFKDIKASIIDDFRESLPELTNEEARSALGSFLFKGEDVFKTIANLSGGEKVRLQLCKILYHKPNFLILDEPTNHMDIIGKEHLEEILSAYTGTIIFVSHDRYFINKIANELLVFEKNEVKHYPYGYQEYLENSANIDSKINSYKPQKEVLKKHEVAEINVYNLKKDLNKIENAIIKKEVEIKKCNEELFKEEVYTDCKKSKHMKARLDALSDELKDLNNTWEELADLIMANK